MDPTRPDPNPPMQGPGLGREAAALAICIGVGVLLSTLPHLLWWPRLGAPVWIADHDELDLYLATAARAYREHPTALSDPVLAAGGATIYPWLQMVPGI